MIRAGHQASVRLAAPPPGASTRIGRSYRGQSFVEVRGFYENRRQFLQFFSFTKSVLAETRCDPRAQTLYLSRFVTGGVAQDFARLFFHASPVALGAALQFFLYRFFQIAYHQLRHAGLLASDIMISHRVRGNAAGFDSSPSSILRV